MQIIIDIPSNLKIMNEQMNVLLSCEIDEIREAIKNGTPLPKGHGRLIDADALIEQIKKFRCIDCNSYNGVRCRACQYDDEMADIDDAPTIIESNNESEVDE